MPIKTKKKSLREYINENELKFYIYSIKYSNELKALETKGISGVEVSFKEKIQKKIRRLNLHISEMSKDNKNKNKIGIEAYKKNIEYLKNLKPPLDKDEIHKKYKEKLDEYINSFDRDLTPADKENIQRAKELELNSNINKERFGEMLLEFTQNIGKMPSFAGYTLNWKIDLYSRAVENVLLYLDNYDENLLSKMTGKPSTTFSYLTQIITNAFMVVLKEFKREEDLLNNRIEYASSTVDGIYNEYKFESTYNPYQEKTLVKDYSNITNKEELDKLIQQDIEEIIKNNSLVEQRELYEYESKEIKDYINSNSVKISNIDKETKNIIEYRKELKNKIKELKHLFEYNTLKIFKNKDISIDFDKYIEDINNPINVSILNKPDINEIITEIHNDIEEEDVWIEW